MNPVARLVDFDLEGNISTNSHAERATIGCDRFNLFGYGNQAGFGLGYGQSFVLNALTRQSDGTGTGLITLVGSYGKGHLTVSQNASSLNFGNPIYVGGCGDVDVGLELNYDVATLSTHLIECLLGNQAFGRLLEHGDNDGISQTFGAN